MSFDIMITGSGRYVKWGKLSAMNSNKRNESTYSATSVIDKTQHSHYSDVNTCLNTNLKIPLNKKLVRLRVFD